MLALVHQLGGGLELLLQCDDLGRAGGLQVKHHLPGGVTGHWSLTGLLPAEVLHTPAVTCL